MTISVITISFNQGRFLPACVGSVMAQREPGDEHICVDPGSSDGSRQWLRSAGVTCVFEPDTGPADGLNKGFSHARGDVLGFLNADDMLAPDALVLVRSFFQSHPHIDAILGGIRVIDEQGRSSWRARMPSACTLLEIASGTAAFYQHGLFIRRSLWDRGLRFNAENRTCWDYEFFFDALRSGARHQVLHNVLGYFRLHSGSISGSGRLNEQYAQDRTRIETAAAGFLHGQAVPSSGQKLHALRRRWAELTPSLEQSTAHEQVRLRAWLQPADLVIAWLGLAFYARRCIEAFVKQHSTLRVVVLASAAGRDAASWAEAAGVRLIQIDADTPTSWEQLGLHAPAHLLATSWTHPGLRALGHAVRQKGGSVTMLADNFFTGSARQWLGALYFRARLAAEFDYAWVPGRGGRTFMRIMGMAEEKIIEGLLAGDASVYGTTNTHDDARTGVLFAGKLIPIKRAVQLWRLWRALGRSDGLIFAGGGEHESILRTEGASLAGELDPVGLAQRMAKASALILPSINDHWGLVVHEAALAGCLLLITRACGAAEDLVEHGINGYVLTDLTRDELGNALAWLEGLTPEQLARGRERSRTLATQFSPARWVQTLEHLLTRTETLPRTSV